MADIDISILGDKKLQRQLIGLVPKLQKRAFKDAAKRALVSVLADARRRVPVKSGRLKRSLKIKPLKGGIGAIVSTGTRKALRIDANDPYYYPAAIEYGTKGKDARPFLRPALLNRTEEVLRIFGRELGPAIERAAKKG